MRQANLAGNSGNSRTLLPSRIPMLGENAAVIQTEHRCSHFGFGIRSSTMNRWSVLIGIGKQIFSHAEYVRDHHLFKYHARGVACHLKKITWLERDTRMFWIARYLWVCLLIAENTNHRLFRNKVVLPKIKIFSQIYGNKNKIRKSFLNIFCFIESTQAIIFSGSVLMSPADIT